MENSLQTTENRQLAQTFDLSKELPNLFENAKELPIDLSSSYWTPEKPGEFKRGFFQRIEPSIYTNEYGSAGRKRGRNYDPKRLQALGGSY